MVRKSQFLSGDLFSRLALDGSRKRQKDQHSWEEGMPGRWGKSQSESLLLEEEEECCEERRETNTF